MAGTTNADLHSFNFSIKSDPFGRTTVELDFQSHKNSRTRQMSLPVEEFPDRVGYVVGLRSAVEF